MTKERVLFQDIGRRSFLKMAGGCGAMTGTSMMSTLLNMHATKAVMAQSGNLSGYKAMVCLFLPGGIDSYNVLAPYTQSEYDDYATVRGADQDAGGLALSREELLAIADAASPRQFGIHPGMTDVRDLYNDGNLAFVANMGSLIEPTTYQDYQNRVKLPLGLFSHADLIRHWQTSVPQSRSQITGWAGRMADLLTDTVNTNPAVSMNIALRSVTVLQTGLNVTPYTVNTDGATVLQGYNGTSDENRILTRANDNLLDQTYSDLLRKTYSRTFRSSIDAAQQFNDATNSISLSTQFPDTDIGRQFEMVAKTIAARGAIGSSRHMFYVSRGGWDHHNEVIQAQGRMLPEISEALKAFYDATVELGVAEDVLTFSASDFARTLTSNGRGSDHAWGGNHFVMGGGVNGGQIYGEYPESLIAGNPLDLGRGRLLPTTSVDEYAAEMALWFGVDNDSNLETILPNIRNFYSDTASSMPIGFMSQNSTDSPTIQPGGGNGPDGGAGGPGLGF